MDRFPTWQKLMAAAHEGGHASPWVRTELLVVPQQPSILSGLMACQGRAGELGQAITSVPGQTSSPFGDPFRENPSYADSRIALPGCRNGYPAAVAAPCQPGVGRGGRHRSLQ